MAENKKRVFLSYTQRDRHFAEELSSLLKRRGANVFSDIDIRPGDRWAGILREEIENATALILLLPSKDALNRNNVWFEAGAAKTLGKPVLMVLPPEQKISGSDVPFDLADMVLLNADEVSLDRLADTLIQAVPESGESKVSAER
jgi:hypothetical protein